MSVKRHADYTFTMQAPSADWGLMAIERTDWQGVLDTMVPPSPPMLFTSVDAIKEWLEDRELGYGPITVTMDEYGLLTIRIRQCMYTLGVIYFVYTEAGTGVEVNTNDYFVESNIQYLHDKYVTRGCTDATASNYDSAALEDDGTCQYTPVADQDLLRQVINEHREKFAIRAKLGEKQCCKETKLMNWLNRIDDIAQRMYTRLVVIQEEVGATAILVFPSFNASSLADNMHIVLTLYYANGTTEVLCDFIDDFFGVDLDTFWTEVAYQISISSNEFTAVANLIDGTLELEAPPGAGANINEAVLQFAVDPYFGVVSTVQQEDLTASPEVFATYVNNNGGNLAGYTFLYHEVDHKLYYFYDGQEIDVCTLPLPLGGGYCFVVYNPETDACYVGRSNGVFSMYIIQRTGQGVFTTNIITGLGAWPAGNGFNNYVYNPYNQCVYIWSAQGIVKIFSDSISAPTILVIDYSSVSAAAFSMMRVNPYNGDILMATNRTGGTDPILLLRNDNTYELVTAAGTGTSLSPFFIDLGDTASSFWGISNGSNSIKLLSATDFSLYGTLTIPTSSSDYQAYYSKVFGKLVVVDITNAIIKMYDLNTETLVLDTATESFGMSEVLGTQIMETFLSWVFDNEELNCMMVQPYFYREVSTLNLMLGIGMAFATPYTLQGAFEGGIDAILQTETDDCVTFTEIDHSIKHAKEIVKTC